MTKVAILPVPTAKGHATYQAVAGNRHAQGKTVGEALDALALQLTEDEGSLIIVQSLRPDRFFTAYQQQRLADLMQRWRLARDQGKVLPADEQSELEALVEAELHATARRATMLVVELER